MDAIPTNSRHALASATRPSSAEIRNALSDRQQNDVSGPEDAAARILAQLPTGIAIASRAGAVAWCNPQFLLLLNADGAPADEVNLQGLLPHETWSVLQQAWDAIAAGRHLSATFRQADGARRSLLLVAEPLLGYEGLLLRLDDVTGQDLAAQLMGATTRRNNQLFGKLRHALRNQLASIGTAVEVIRLQNRESVDTAEMCDVIERQVKRIAGQSNDLRDGNPLTTTQASLQRQRQDLRKLVFEVCRVHQAQLPFELQLVAPDDEMLIEGDGPLLSQAFANLLRALATADEPAEHVRVDIVGQPGVAELRLNIRRRNLPLQSAAANPSAEYHPHQSPPLAPDILAIRLLARLAELHNGEFSWPSQSGARQELCFRLPLVSDDRVAPSRPENTSHSEAALRCCRVLLVEDDTEFAASLKRLLAVLGNEVEVTSDGETAVELAQAFQPDVVLCDLQLPGRMDGHAVAQALRDANIRAKLVAVSGEALEGDPVPPGSSFDQVLAKPIGLEALKRLLPASHPVALRGK